MYSNILVAVDGSKSNSHAVDKAIELAKTLGSSLTAITVFDVGNYKGESAASIATDSEYMKSITSSALEYVVSRAKEADIPLVTKVAYGSPAASIVEESKNHDLVICGTLGRTGLKRMLIGSVAEMVVRLAYCPVLVIRNSEE
ncbi:MAG: universal stress protein [archaeon]|nr:universal stress protein [archaeon]